MIEELHLKATVQPGGKIEVVCPELEAGQAVEVTVRTAPELSGRSILDILNSGPERRLFKTAKEVDDYIREERESWDR